MFWFSCIVLEDIKSFFQYSFELMVILSAVCNIVVHLIKSTHFFSCWVFSNLHRGCPCQNVANVLVLIDGDVRQCIRTSEEGFDLVLLAELYMPTSHRVIGKELRTHMASVSHFVEFKPFWMQIHTVQDLLDPLWCFKVLCIHFSLEAFE